MMTTSASYNFGDVGLTLFDFGNGRPPKPRPVVVVSDQAFNEQRPEVIVAPISSKTDVIQFGDFQVTDWGAAGLRVPGRVSAAIDTIPRGAIRKRLGSMGGKDQAALLSMLAQVFGLALPRSPSR